MISFPTLRLFVTIHVPMPVYKRNKGLLNSPCSSPDLTLKELVDKIPLSPWGERGDYRMNVLSG